MGSEPKMRLFVWTEFRPDYSYGLAFAIAENIEQAQAEVVKRHGDFGDWGHAAEFPVTEPIAFAVSGGG